MDSAVGRDPRLTVVLPAHDEAEVIGSTIQRITEATRTLGQVAVVVVSDGSSDDTYSVASAAVFDHGRGFVIELAKNVGSHAAIRAGLRAVDSGPVVVMAADGQDPPETIPRMLEALDQGADLVWGTRQGRRRDPFPRRLLASLFYRIFRVLTGLDYPPRGYDFVAFQESVLRAVNQHRERNAPLFLMLYNIGFRQTEVGYQRGERVGGSSSWTLRKRLKLGLDMITAFSPAPIRAVSLLGGLIGLFGVVFGGITVVRALLGQTPADGWASLMVVSSLLSGLTLLALALIGEYLWRALDEARGRPLYIERRRARFDPRRDRGRAPEEP